MASTDNTAASYTCLDPRDELCAINCTSLAACSECNCVVQSDNVGGDWGEVMDVIFCILPIVFLIVVTIKPQPLSTTVSLPTAALLMYCVRLMYLQSDPILTTGAVVLGVLEALTPLSIMAGAITLFESMEASYCLPYMMREIKILTNGHPIAEMMLIFSFAYTVEGASGFGTPVALGAPMLVSTGHPPLESVVVLLIMNTFATVWGAVGTPIWYGLGSIGTPPEAFLDISYKAAISLGISAYLLMPFVLSILVPFSMVRQNIVFVMLSLSTCIIPSVAIAFLSYEFPALIGGIVGCIGTAVVIRYKICLKDISTEQQLELLQRNVQDIGSMSEHSFTNKHKKISGINNNKKQFHKNSSSISDISYEGGKPKSLRAMESGTTSAMQSSTISPPINTANNGGPAMTTVHEDRIEMEHNHNGQDTNSMTEPISDESNEKLDTGNTNDTAKVDGVPSERNLHISGEADNMTQQVALEAHLGPRKSKKEGYIKEITMRTFPIWAVVLILILTRVQQIGLKVKLTNLGPYFDIHFGTFGTFRLSSSLVFQLRDILTYPGLNWKYELLYVPFLLPFLIVSILTLLIYRKDLSCRPTDIVHTVAARLRNPAIALLGALILVQLMIRTGTDAPANILGSILSDWFKQAFIIISPLLGAMGSFFSGSTTVSNLTFGSIQTIAATSIGTSVTTMLALQTVGASAGNGICLNNIIAACAVVGLNIGEGQVLMRTFKLVFANTTIATIVMLALFFRF